MAISSVIVVLFSFIFIDGCSSPAYHEEKRVVEEMPVVEIKSNQNFCEIIRKSISGEKQKDSFWAVKYILLEINSQDPCETNGKYEEAFESLMSYVVQIDDLWVQSEILVEIAYIDIFETGGSNLSFLFSLVKPAGLKTSTIVRVLNSLGQNSFYGAKQKELDALDSIAKLLEKSPITFCPEEDPFNVLATAYMRVGQFEKALKISCRIRFSSDKDAFLLSFDKGVSSGRIEMEKKIPEIVRNESKCGRLTQNFDSNLYEYFKSFVTSVDTKSKKNELAKIKEMLCESGRCDVAIWLEERENRINNDDFISNFEYACSFDFQRYSRRKGINNNPALYSFSSKNREEKYTQKIKEGKISSALEFAISCENPEEKASLLFKMETYYCDCAPKASDGTDGYGIRILDE
jgi:hypothetical protein